MCAVPETEGRLWGLWRLGVRRRGRNSVLTMPGQGWLMKMPLSEASTTPKSRESLNLKSNKVGLRLAGWWKVKALVDESCPTLCDPMDCSPPGSSVHGILQARILQWVAIAFSRGSSSPRDQTQVSNITGRFLTI